MLNHSDRIRKILFLENGNLVTASQDGTIKVWNSLTGKLIIDLKAPSNWVSSLVQLSNGWLASGLRDGSIYMWDINDNKPIKTLSGHKKAVCSLQVLPNGRLASCAFDDTIMIWNPVLAEGNLLLTIRGHGIDHHRADMGVLSNGHLVTCSNEDTKDNTIRVWNTTSGRLAASIQLSSRNARSLLVLSSQQVAVGCQDGTIKVIDIKKSDDSEATVMRHGANVFSLVQLSNGNLASSGSSGPTISDIKIWNLEYGCLVQSITTSQGAISSIDFFPRKKFIASGSIDKSVKLWRLDYE